MEVCYYCGGPLKKGETGCRFCGTPVNPLDVPLCSPEPDVTMDEPAILQVGEVEPPPQILYDDMGFESSAGAEAAEAEPEETEIPSGEEAEPVRFDEQVPEDGEPSAAPAADERFETEAIPDAERACILTKYRDDHSMTLSVPAEISGMQVMEIGKAALAHASFREVILPDTVQRIGDYAFTGCAGLQSVTGGANVKELGRGALNGCLRLTECSFLLNDGLKKPGDPMLNSIIQRLRAGAAADHGEQA